MFSLVNTRKRYVVAGREILKLFSFLGKCSFLPYLVIILLSCCWLHCSHFLYDTH